ncbi:unnamed protein product [Candida verbasci]|uniref:Uncharacterized protein n=1 Tax=Candida verbasci TaxID=1227364 RepID=A0A9W4TVW2_9ASCO|nr:unnamed protein product [Candida verbasci]
MFKSIRPVVFKRGLKVTRPKLSNLNQWKTIVQILTGAYIGGIIVISGSLYFIYSDANKRQPIPLELNINDQVNSVMAINKDEVLGSPRFASKHYRALLVNLYKEIYPDYKETNGYDIPILDYQALLKKNTKFVNFYIDMVLRYAKTLLAKGESQISVSILRRIINDDFIFENLADPEKLSNGSRLLSKITSDTNEKEQLLNRSIAMLSSAFNFQVKDNIIQNMKLSDELLFCLNDLAFVYAKSGKLNESLTIYLSNLKILEEIKTSLENGKSQINYPLFNCNSENITLQICSLKAHISEILFAKNYKDKAIQMSQEVIDEIFYDYNSNPNVSPILINVLHNLKAMYKKIGDEKEMSKCQNMIDGLPLFDADLRKSFYDEMISKWSKIIYELGPIGIITKPLSERYGPKQRIKELEEIENE